jgi:hypothetical protein
MKIEMTSSSGKIAHPHHQKAVSNCAELHLNRANLCQSDIQAALNDRRAVVSYPKLSSICANLCKSVRELASTVPKSPFT